MAKNVVVTVEDYLMRKDPEKYKKMLEPKEEKEKETVDILTSSVDAYGEEKRELLAEIERLEGARAELQAEIKELKVKIKKLEAENKKLKKAK